MKSAYLGLLLSFKLKHLNLGEFRNTDSKI